LLATVIFDVFHYFCHRAAKSKNTFLKSIANKHMVHHRFFYPMLQINKTLIQQNLRHHVILEYLIHIFVIALCFLFMHPLAVILALLFETGIFLYVCCVQGMDAHHQPRLHLHAPRGGVFVNRDYHALHHIFPHRYYSSLIKIFDYCMGTGMQLKGKRIAMTGANGALGKHMKILLEKEGAIISTFQFGKDYTYDNYEIFKTALTEIDILILCHGSKFHNAMLANCDSFIHIIETFKATRKKAILPLEIWGVGSEIECHPSFGFKKLKVYSDSKRQFAKKAREYFHDRNIQYRHLVHSAFISKMGPGLMSAKFAARMTIFLIKRGFKYVPVTYTGIAWINYFRHFLIPPPRVK
jgi:hypothetical protein